MISPYNDEPFLQSTHMQSALSYRKSSIWNNVCFSVEVNRERGTKTWSERQTSASYTLILTPAHSSVSRAVVLRWKLTPAGWHPKHRRLRTEPKSTFAQLSRLVRQLYFIIIVRLNGFSWAPMPINFPHCLKHGWRCPGMPWPRIFPIPNIINKRPIMQGWSHCVSADWNALEGDLLFFIFCKCQLD